MKEAGRLLSQELLKSINLTIMGTSSANKGTAATWRIRIARLSTYVEMKLPIQDKHADRKIHVQGGIGVIWL